MKKCPYADKINLENFLKFIDFLEKKYKYLNSPVEKYWVEAIIKDIEINKNKDKIDIEWKINKPFLVLLGVVLSQRTKDEVTFRAAKSLFEKVKNPYDVLKLSEEEITKLIYPVGFYKNKANTIKQIAKDIIEKYGWKVPDKLDEILKLKGVGLKTANLVLSVWFWKPAICVDTHVHRICNRLGIVKTKTPEETEKELRKILPKKYWNKINKLLIAFWQTICRPVRPRCEECFIKDILDS